MRYFEEPVEQLMPHWAFQTDSSVRVRYSFILPDDSARVTYVARSLASFLPINSEAMVVPASRREGTIEIASAILSRLLGAPSFSAQKLGAIQFESGEADIAEGVIAVLLLFNINFILLLENGWLRLEYGKSRTMIIEAYRQDIDDDFRVFIEDYSGRKLA
jgi:hypothetical protein